MMIDAAGQTEGGRSYPKIGPEAQWMHEAGKKPV